MEGNYIKSIIVIFLLFSLRNLFAVVNTEDLRKNLDSNGVYNTSEIMFGLRSGNVNFNEIGITHRTDFIKDWANSFLIGSFQYKDNNDNIIDRNGFLHLRSQLTPENKLKPEFFLQAEFDEFRNLKERYLGGSNMRLDIASKDSAENQKIRFTLGTGLMYEIEVIDEGTDYTSYIWRHNNYLTFDYKLTNNFSFRTVTYIQYDIFSTSDFRVLNETVLLTKITDILEISISFTYRYDNEPALETIHYDSLIRNGLRINF